MYELKFLIVIFVSLIILNLIGLTYVKYYLFNSICLAHIKMIIPIFKQRMHIYPISGIYLLLLFLEMRSNSRKNNKLLLLSNEDQLIIRIIVYPDCWRVSFLGPSRVCNSLLKKHQRVPQKNICQIDLNYDCYSRVFCEVRDTAFPRTYLVMDLLPKLH